MVVMVGAAETAIQARLVQTPTPLEPKVGPVGMLGMLEMEETVPTAGTDIRVGAGRMDSTRVPVNVDRNSTSNFDPSILGSIPMKR